MNKIKFLLYSGAFLVLTQLASISANACYLYWHHAPEMPDCLREE